MTNETNVEQWVKEIEDALKAAHFERHNSPETDSKIWKGKTALSSLRAALTRQGDADTDTEIVAAMFEWAKRLKPELRDLLVDVHAIFAGWMNDEHWTEWDESVRLRVVGMQKKMENSNNPVYEDSWMWVVTQKQYDLFKILHKITGHYFTKEETFKIINAI
jgi:hypothetical protein